MRYFLLGAGVVGAAAYSIHRQIWNPTSEQAADQRSISDVVNNRQQQQMALMAKFAEPPSESQCPTCAHMRRVWNNAVYQGYNTVLDLTAKLPSSARTFYEENKNKFTREK
eukprot:GILJ01004402.1.p1 GENE.GILJ01004402.1~~GILJ01004402.1.p1  ORF type:complete len:111 (+),score=13.01 GILJ01004402.1:41-373(+)